MNYALLSHILERFDIPGALVACAPHGAGHINDTFLAAFEAGGGGTRRYILQRINRSVFACPERVMENIANVTAHLSRKAEAKGVSDLARRVLTTVPTLGGGALAHDADGGAWRCYVFVEGARARQTVGSPREAFEVAKAYGSFQRDMADYDGPRLFETIPGFHDTRARMAALHRAIGVDKFARASSAKEEIAFALSREGLCGCLLGLRDMGQIAERVTHNDTKLDNVLMDDATGEGICVVDLDTVMPGLSLYDFGDMVRSSVGLAAEDERDLSRVAVRLPIFEALASGYLEGSGGSLLPIERENMVASAKLMTLECGIRFLTDHLAGDSYFHIERESQNLDRCRAQFALLRSLEENEGLLADCVASSP